MFLVREDFVLHWQEDACTVDNETLGGAATHNEISGIADYKFKTEQECLDQVKKIISKLGHPKSAGFDRIKSNTPAKDPAEMYGIIPSDSSKPYDMIEIIDRIVDRDSNGTSGLEQFKAEYGKTIVCGYARIDGWAVGIVANQRKIVKSRKGEMQMGGVIYNDSADKAAIYHELQSEKDSACFSAGCNWFYGRVEKRACGHYQRRG